MAHPAHKGGQSRSCGRKKLSTGKRKASVDSGPSGHKNQITGLMDLQSFYSETGRAIIHQSLPGNCDQASIFFSSSHRMR